MPIQPPWFRTRIHSYFWWGLTFRVAEWYVGEVVDSANRIASHRETVIYTDGGPVYHEYI